MNNNDNKLPPSGFNPSPFDSEDNKPCVPNELDPKFAKYLLEHLANTLEKEIKKNLANAATLTSFNVSTSPDGKKSLKLKIQPNQNNNLPKEKQVLSFFEADMNKLNYRLVLGCVYDFFVETKQLDCLNNLKTREEFIDFHWKHIFSKMLNETEPPTTGNEITITL